MLDHVVLHVLNISLTGEIFIEAGLHGEIIFKVL
jgi:hypothetical protein